MKLFLLKNTKRKMIFFRYDMNSFRNITMERRVGCVDYQFLMKS